LSANSNDAAAPRIAGLGLLFGTIYFVQSVGDPSSGLIAQPVRSLLYDWGEGPLQIALFTAVMALPWVLKPLLALLSDFAPLFGSRRRSYLTLSTAAAALGLGVLYFVPLPPGETGLLLVLLFVPTLGIAFTDVLADGLMIEVGKPRGLVGRLQSVQWFAAYLALLLAGVLGGYLAARDGASLGEALGGGLYGALAADYDATAAHRGVLVASLAVIASCWLFVPALRRASADW
jgi:hypothetical protein